MKTSIIAVATALLTSNLAMAGGLTHTLPADASNIKISTISLGTIATGQKLINDGQDGPAYESVFSPAIDVSVTYESSDHSDDATQLDNRNDPVQVVVGGPTLNFSFRISESEASEIRAGSLDAKSLLKMNVQTTRVVYNDEEFSRSCRFNISSSRPENPECILHTQHVENRPVITIDRN